MCRAGVLVEVALVGALLLLGCPPAVSWLVIAVAVRALYGHVGGSVAHIRKEVGEVLPSVANLNASPAIRPVIVVVRVCASLFHVGPTLVRAPIVLGSTVFHLGHHPFRRR